jgi:hypothetical protein
MGAAEHLTVLFHAVTEDAAAAMQALRGYALRRALDAVEGVRATGVPYLEGLVVVVAANITSRHGMTSLCR